MIFEISMLLFLALLVTCYEPAAGDLQVTKAL